MLHEILLSLSGHPSPLLRNGALPHGHGADAGPDQVLSPPERDLLRAAGHLSDLHRRLQDATARIAASHPTVICRAVAAAIRAVHLAAFQRKILEVEDSILRRDAALVGAYSIVPLTAVVGEFTGWTRRLEWLCGLVQFMSPRADHANKPQSRPASPCRAAQLINKLRGELQTGYADVADTALSLVKVAETAWLKQVSAWVLYGRIPTLGEDDFFIRRDEQDEQGYSIDRDLLPSFVSPPTARSMLFIGISLNRVRARSPVDTDNLGAGHLSSQLEQLSGLDLPLSSAMLSRAITSIRSALSRTTLQKLLPLSKVLDLLQILREFFLIGRGEFAMALTQQADEKIRSRWRRADNLAYEKRDVLSTLAVKEGEVSAVLSRTWAVLVAMQGEHAEEDETLELARGLLRLSLAKANDGSHGQGSTNADRQHLDCIAAASFRDLLFSVPVVLTLQIPSPLDLFLSNSDLQIYTSINSYLLSIRRAHLRLTDLWKVSALRRHHPAPPRPPYSQTRGGMAKIADLRERWTDRSLVMRSPWSTSSAAIFFLAEIESYLQVEIVEGLWEHFHSWVKKGEQCAHDGAHPGNPTQSSASSSKAPNTLGAGPTTPITPNTTTTTTTATSTSTTHDPQSLAAAHRRYLRALTRRLLLTRASFAGPLHALLRQVDRLAALLHRLSGVWAALDLEADEGVVDAFSDLAAEERAALGDLKRAEDRVRAAVRDAVAALRDLSADPAFIAECEGDMRGAADDDDDYGGDDEDDTHREQGGGGGQESVWDAEESGSYVPKRVGGIDRLLMKLDFGSWFESSAGGESGGGDNGF